MNGPIQNITKINYNLTVKTWRKTNNTRDKTPLKMVIEAAESVWDNKNYRQFLHSQSGEG